MTPTSFDNQKFFSGHISWLWISLDSSTYLRKLVDSAYFGSLPDLWICKEWRTDHHPAPWDAIDI